MAEESGKKHHVVLWIIGGLIAAEVLYLIFRKKPTAAAAPVDTSTTTTTVPANGTPSTPDNPVTTASPVTTTGGTAAPVADTPPTPPAGSPAGTYLGTDGNWYKVDGTPLNGSPVSQSLNEFMNSGTGLTIPQEVADFLNGLPPNNKAQAFKMLPSMTQADINGLDDLILNDWDKTGKATAAQTAFWNAWRTKYHVSDGTYKN